MPVKIIYDVVISNVFKNNLLISIPFSFFPFHFTDIGIKTLKEVSAHEV